MKSFFNSRLLNQSLLIKIFTIFHFCLIVVIFILIYNIFAEIKTLQEDIQDAKDLARKHERMFNMMGDTYEFPKEFNRK